MEIRIMGFLAVCVFVIYILLRLDSTKVELNKCNLEKQISTTTSTTTSYSTTSQFTTTTIVYCFCGNSN